MAIKIAAIQTKSACADYKQDPRLLGEVGDLEYLTHKPMSYFVVVLLI
jgi:hypothetical protein